MKKKSKIRLIKDNQKNEDSYTFVTDAMGLSSIQDAKASLNSKKAEDNTGATNVDNMNEIRKKKKVLTNEDVKGFQRSEIQ